MELQSPLATVCATIHPLRIVRSSDCPITYIHEYIWKLMWKKKVMRISKQPSPVTIMIDKKQLEDVECFKYLGSKQMMEDVRVKLNPELPWQKLRSTRRLFSPANWT
jgi:hypothetical protein